MENKKNQNKKLINYKLFFQILLGAVFVFGFLLVAPEAEAKCFADLMDYFPDTPYDCSQYCDAGTGCGRAWENEGEPLWRLNCTGASGSFQSCFAGAPDWGGSSFSASAITIPPGGSTTLSWWNNSLTGGVCVASNGTAGWPGDKGSSGSQVVSPASTTTYTLVCGPPGNIITYRQTHNRTITVQAVPAPTINSFSASPSSIIQGNSSTLSWSTSNATSCTASGAWSGSKSVNGSQSVTPGSTGTFNYTLQCWGPGGTVTRIATITVNPPAQYCGDGSCNNGETYSTCPSDCPPPAVTLSLNASPGTITSGNSSALSWNVQNATACTASGGWSGAKAFSNGLHTETVSPTNTQTYNLNCSNVTGGTTQQATVVVTAAPVITPTLTFSASPSTITSGNSSTLTWNVQDADGCWGYDGDWGDGSRSFSNGLHTQAVLPTSTQTYSLDCWHNGGGSITRYATVNVNPVPTPTVTLTASPNPTAAPGNPTTLTWTTNNATSCTATGGWSGAKAFANGPHTESVSPSSTTTYSLECRNSAGVSTGIRNVTVTVNCVPAYTYACTNIGTTCDLPTDCGQTLTDSALCTQRNSCTGALTSVPLSNCGSCADIPVACDACSTNSGNWKEVAP